MSATTSAQPAPGELSLSTLLRSLTTVLHTSTFVWITIPSNQGLSHIVPTQMIFKEAEGTTIITTKEAAEENNLEYTFPSRMITLNVHSSLEAVGFIAVISRRLTELQIGVNPVSGFFHDHLFVPEGKEEDAMKVLHTMAEEAKMQS